MLGKTEYIFPYLSESHSFKTVGVSGKLKPHSLIFKKSSKYKKNFIYILFQKYNHFPNLTYSDTQKDKSRNKIHLQANI